jgi:hypothetical protein
LSALAAFRFAPVSIYLAATIAAQGAGMPTGKQAFLGSWSKVSTTPCSQPYPEQLVFQESGRYRGQNAAPGRFTIWDVGTFDVVGENEVKISTANDAVRSYAVTVARDTLKFVDPERCEIEYRRD